MSLENLNGTSIIIESIGPVGTSTGPTPAASLATARSFHASAELDGLIYVFGGLTASGATALVEQYDPDTDTWTTVASMTTARERLAGAAVDGGVYAIGGAVQQTVEEYDPDTNSWSTVAPLTTARERLAGAVFGGRIYAIAGRSPNTNEIASVEEYNPNTNAWNAAPSLNTARVDSAAAGADSEIYVSGGKDVNANRLSSVEELAVQSLPEIIFTATGDTLVSTDAPEAVVRNVTTGRESIGGIQLARAGETIAFQTNTNARLFRTEEK
jgi:hypothetical protein